MFAGIGGFRLGIENAANKLNIPVKCVFSSEIEKNAMFVYEKNFGEKPHGDITKIQSVDIPDMDILCGGFPCQSFSIAGKRRGFDDTRGTLFFEIARIARDKRPKILFLENVKGLLNHDQGRTFGTILYTLDELGYDVEWQVLNSKDFGVPQNRERTFIIGHLRGGRTGQIFPLKRSHGQITQSVKTQTAIRYPIKYGRRNQRVIDGDYSYALDVMGTGGVYEFGKGVRHLTPIERERLQGFPDGWTSGIPENARKKCLGNTVSVPVIEAISTKILQSFNNL